MVPRVVHGITGNSGRMPFLTLIIPDVPFVPSGDTAFVPPDVRLAVNELIDVELERLRHAEIGYVEIHVVGKIVDIRNKGVIGIGKTLRGKITDQVIVP